MSMDNLYGRGPMMDAVEALNEFHKLPMAEQRRAREEFAVELVRQQLEDDLEA